MALQHETLSEFDAAHVKMFVAIEEFFRYAKRHPDAKAEMEEYFNDDYYKRVADALHKRVDHELKYLHSPYIT